MAKKWETPKDPNEVLDYFIDWSRPARGRHHRNLDVDGADRA